MRPPSLSVANGFPVPRRKTIFPQVRFSMEHCGSPSDSISTSSFSSLAPSSQLPAPSVPAPQLSAFQLPASSFQLPSSSFQLPAASQPMSAFQRVSVSAFGPSGPSSQLSSILHPHSPLFLLPDNQQPITDNRPLRGHLPSFGCFAALPSRVGRRPFPVTAQQEEIWRSLSAQEKYALFSQLMRMLRELKTAGVRQRHPDWTGDQVSQEVSRIFASCANPT